MEQGTPGERGICVPLAEEGRHRGRRHGRGLHPRGDEPRGRPRPARDVAVPGHAPLPALLADDPGHGPGQRHQRGHLHDEVQPEDARGAHPRAQGRRRAPLAGRGHHAGAARDRLRHGAVPEVDLGHGRLHAAARRRLARRVHQRVRHAPPLRGQGRARPAQRDDHDDLLAPVRRGDADGGRLQGHHRHARRERLPGPRGLQGRGQREDRRLHDHQPRGHRHLQPADRQVRRGAARRRRPGLHRPGQRQRHPRLRAGP